MLLYTNRRAVQRIETHIIYEQILMVVQNDATSEYFKVEKNTDCIWTALKR